VPVIVAMTGGGIKGAVAAARYASNHDLIFLHVNYAQPSASAELKAVKGLAGSFPSAKVLGLDLPHVSQLESSLPGRSETSQAPRSADANRTKGFSGGVLRGLMPVLMSVAVQCAMRVGALKIVTGLSRWCEAIHLGLPPVEAHGDSRREFLHAVNIMIEDLGVQRSSACIEAPLIDMTYADVIKLAMRFRLPLEHTWTCEKSGALPCRRCDACQARSRAFIEGRIVDPLARAVSPTSSSPNHS